MSNTKYREVKSLNLPSIDKEILEFWKQEKVFEQSISSRKDAPTFVFYEGPPSANGLPGIHHVMARTIKDIFCRYKTQKGFLVERKGGWDTHGLPIELQVEKDLGITKEDIGKKISVEEYNERCRKDVIRFKDKWEELTEKMGFWLDMDNPYITYKNEYIESLWHLLKMLYDKGLLYKGYTIQPFSPAAGTQLSSHELNQPGCYRNVKDTSVTAQFKIKDRENEYFLAWTTTPWTLPSNTALAVGEKVDYVKVDTWNPYTFDRVKVILAKELLSKYFSAENERENVEEYQPGEKQIPWKKLEEVKGKELVGLRYEQLLSYAQPEEGDAFRVIPGDFVTTDDGTGIVHIAPSFGADDMRVARQQGIGALTMVDKQGRFTEEMGEFAGMPVKDFYSQDGYEIPDIKIAVKLKQENKAFRVEKFEHSYPHCWRTDKPIIYFPMESWFVRVTDYKERMAELNKTINWKPESTGTGRFGNWLENLVDWNLSRSRYWGTPLPVWRTEDGEEEICIGSIEELRAEVRKSVEAGFMDAPLADDFDLHRPYVDRVFLVSKSGKKMTRETDLVDVWFDSGAMPYAQWHFPFENLEKFKDNYPADFIAEGVDQTRGWFYTLHAIAVLLFDSVAYKNVISNGLVLDKNGNKMSKRLGNAVDPYQTIEGYGADATRWYLISNAQPWDNLKFDSAGIVEVQRKFFGTLFNTYSFFSLYANIDGFRYAEKEIPVEQRPEIDQWIISKLNSLIAEVEAAYEDYEPTKAARLIQNFTDRHLSNWYVRLCRRRFWKGEYSDDKIAAYQTLYRCLEALSGLIAPVAPFFSEFLFINLNKVSGKQAEISVHLAKFPQPEINLIDKSLEERMELAQVISSLVLSLRKRVDLKVRQPLKRVLIPVLNPKREEQIRNVENLILSEVNVKEIEYVSDTSGVIIKKIKPDFKILGRKLGPKMKQVAQVVSQMTQEEIRLLEKEGFFRLKVENDVIELQRDEVEITSEDIPGWLVASEGDVTVALDVSVTEDLRDEGNAREFVNKIQRLRKEMDFNVTDRVLVEVQEQEALKSALINYKSYICTEILAENLTLVHSLENGNTIDVNDIPVRVNVYKK